MNNLVSTSGSQRREFKIKQEKRNNKYEGKNKAEKQAEKTEYQSN